MHFQLSCSLISLYGILPICNIYHTERGVGGNVDSDSDSGLRSKKESDRH